jgi:hypothetical protein
MTLRNKHYKKTLKTLAEQATKLGQIILQIL